MSASLPRNIAYKTTAIARYFASNRLTWEQFYLSERWVLERLGTERGIKRVLDVGCAAGGLGLALEERFTLERYVGVDINPDAIEVARAREQRYRCAATFHLGDILGTSHFEGGPFDLVANLSCSDWNIETDAITSASWRHVAPGGSLVISLRLTDGVGVNDFRRSYQYIQYDGLPNGTEEKANYVVFNVADALRMLQSFEPSPANVLGYGYWGTPSKVAVTPYDRLTFAVFAVTKPSSAGSRQATQSELHLPLSLWTRAAEV